MLKLQFLIFLLIILLSSSLIAENYVISINGTSKEINLDKEVSLVLSDGTSLRVMLHQKEYSKIDGHLISFEYKSEFKPTQTNI